MYSRRMLIPFPRYELRSYPFHTPKKRPVQEAWDSVVDRRLPPLGSLDSAPRLLASCTAFSALSLATSLSRLSLLSYFSNLRDEKPD